MLVVQAFKTVVIGVGLGAIFLSVLSALVALLASGRIDLFAPFPSPWGPPLPTLFLFGVGFLVMGIMAMYYEKMLRLQ